MEKYQTIHEYDERHRLIKISIRQLLELPMENWKHNRPPDEIRVSEIESFIQKRTNQILQPFYIHYNPKINVYEILDGIHRYSAIKSIREENVLEKMIFVHLFIDLTYGNLIDIFNDLNKTVPVPELYITSTQDNSNEKDTIEEIVKHWQKLYKQHFSSSNNYTIPNINRDSFINLLSDLYTSYRIRNKTKLIELLEKANTNIKNYVTSGLSCRQIPTKFTENQKKKCSESGCYLFLYKDINTIKYFTEL
jgi:hypothetical protein